MEPNIGRKGRWKREKQTPKAKGAGKRATFDQEAGKSSNNLRSYKLVSFGTAIQRIKGRGSWPGMFDSYEP